ncbi:protein shisa-like-2A isoform X2 [Anomalospiza imberbis]|uniref:protein shisa-like-2A isoform X2 n=1 Tax=Anomalospiza imberbis TaxID=187417 RepID=UPI00358F0C46
MSAECSSYLNADKVLVSGFSCPRAGGDARAVFCCGFQDVKYCCDDPHSFFPYEHSYMWWLRADLGGAQSRAQCPRCGCGKTHRVEKRGLQSRSQFHSVGGQCVDVFVCQFTLTPRFQ